MVNIPEFISKGWGYESILVNKEFYCGKILFIKMGKRLSLHYHKLKDETFYIQSGKVELVCYCNPEKDVMFPTWDVFHKKLNQKGTSKWLIRQTLEQGQTYHIPVGLRHTLYGFQDSHVIEFSTQHFDSDSYRVLKGN